MEDGVRAMRSARSSNLSRRWEDVQTGGVVTHDDSSLDNFVDGATWRLLTAVRIHWAAIAPTVIDANRDMWFATRHSPLYSLYSAPFARNGQLPAE